MKSIGKFVVCLRMRVVKIVLPSLSTQMLKSRIWRLMTTRKQSTQPRWLSLLWWEASINEGSRINLHDLLLSLNQFIADSKYSGVLLIYFDSYQDPAATHPGGSAPVHIAI